MFPSMYPGLSSLHRHLSLHTGSNQTSTGSGGQSRAAPRSTPTLRGQVHPAIHPLPPLIQVPTETDTSYVPPLKSACNGGQISGCRDDTPAHWAPGSVHSLVARHRRTGGRRQMPGIVKSASHLRFLLIFLSDLRPQKQGAHSQGGCS